MSKKKTSRRTKCLSCALRNMCGMCPANGVLEGGDVEEPVDFLCQVTHLRACAFEIPIPPHGGCDNCPGGANYQEMMETIKRLAPWTQDRVTKILSQALPAFVGVGLWLTSSTALRLRS